ncbi:MAG: hypothetical protein NPINA01_32300 [Nitrospinaceae bacterium]|nr:MAG: hypothetical protein NPINA01_32300 [Nitrospinaceae bacterium]
MILKASQRSGARSFATHLLNKKENDHVEVYEIRDLAAGKLHGAFLEIEAVSQGTRAKQPFFAVTFNPPDHANVTLEEFEAAFGDVEQKLGLTDQPRAVVFHEKEGRRHAHVVWSRIVHHIDQEKGTDKLKAINMPHFKSKLQDVSRDLYIQHGWEMPRGLQSKKERDSLNFGLDVWQQAKRLKEDPRDLKKIVQEALKVSDSAKAFSKALQLQGLNLACGERRGKANFVIIHHSGEVMSLTRYSGLKTKELNALLGDPKTFPSVEQVQKKIEVLKTAALTEKINNLKKGQKKQREPLKAKLMAMREKQRAERKALKEKQEKRWQREELSRAKRLRKGLMGFWDRFTGKRTKVSRQNKKEAEEGLKRDKKEKQALIDRHLKERRALQEKFKDLKAKQNQEMAQARYGIGIEMKKQKGKLKKAWQEKDNIQNKEKLSETWKEAAGSGSGDAKVPPLKDTFKESSSKNLKQSFNEKTKKSRDKGKGHVRKNERGRDDHNGRERKRDRGPGGGPRR